MKLYKNGSCIIIWDEYTKEQYWFYTIIQATKLFKKKHNLRGKVQRVDYCPYIFN